MFEKVVCKNRKELYQFLKDYNIENKTETSLSSVYYLVSYDNRIEPLYFLPFEGSYFESPCILILHETIKKESDIEDYVREIYEKDSYNEALEYEKTLFINGKHFEIENPQCSPFLDKDIVILDVLSESECIKYLLKEV